MQVKNHYICVLKIIIMAKYKVIKAFYKLSEAKNYTIGDTIELSAEDAKSMNGYVVEIKEDKPKSKK